MHGNTKEITFKMNGSCMECSSHASGSNGYPKIKRNGKTWTMSRHVYTQKHGKIPKGKMIRHTCHNRMCINIEHLLIGTHQDNMDDKVKRNRQSPGITTQLVTAQNENKFLRDELDLAMDYIITIEKR